MAGCERTTRSAVSWGFGLRREEERVAAKDTAPAPGMLSGGVPAGVWEISRHASLLCDLRHSARARDTRCFTRSVLQPSDPMTAYHFAVFVHLLAAFVWLGGMFFFAIVGAPVVRSVDDPAMRAGLFRDLGLRFRSVGWGAIGILIATGIWILHLRGLLRAATLFDPGWWGTPLGTALAWKLAVVVGMVGLSAIHDFLLGPRASRTTSRPGRRWALLLARVNVLLGLVLLYWAMRLARGG